MVNACVILAGMSVEVHYFLPVQKETSVWGHTLYCLIQQGEKSAWVHSFLPVYNKFQEHFSVGIHSSLPVISRKPRMQGYTLSCLYYNVLLAGRKSAQVHSFLPLLVKKLQECFSAGAHSFLPVISRETRMYAQGLSSAQKSPDLGIQLTRKHNESIEFGKIKLASVCSKSFGTAHESHKQCVFVGHAYQPCLLHCRQCAFCSCTQLAQCGQVRSSITLRQMQMQHAGYLLQRALVLLFLQLSRQHFKLIARSVENNEVYTVAIANIFGLCYTYSSQLYHSLYVIIIYS